MLAIPVPSDLLTPAEADRLLLSSDSVLVDVRSTESLHRSGMIAGSTHIPAFRLRVGEAGLERHSRLIIVGEDVDQATEAVRAFRKAGFWRISVLAGGFVAWLTTMPVVGVDEPRYGLGA